MLKHATQLVDQMDDRFEQDIRHFKVEFCDETQLIVGALTREFSEFVQDPILDVGAGFQAISVQSFPGHDITLLDTIAYQVPETQEKRVTGDFFDYTPTLDGRPRTILFCHVLQYLDDNLSRLYEKIGSLDPARIIAVVNDNDGQFGGVIRWAKRHLPTANPEVNVPMGAIGYDLTRRARISATLACQDFETLAYQFGRLILDLSVETARSPALLAHLRSTLKAPTIRINQSILGYEKQTHA